MHAVPGRRTGMTRSEGQSHDDPGSDDMQRQRHVHGKDDVNEPVIMRMTKEKSEKMSQEIHF